MGDENKGRDTSEQRNMKNEYLERVPIVLYGTP